jgi:hypothetical protein
MINVIYGLKGSGKTEKIIAGMSKLRSFIALQY